MVDAPTRVTCLKGLPRAEPVAGIEYRMFVQRFDRMPEWGKLTPAASGRTERFDITPFAANPAFGVQWKGFLKIEREGLYSFTLGSDDGSVLRIAGAVVVENDGPHPYSERTAKAYLAPGAYPFEIGYFESGGAERFEAWFEGPGISRRRLDEGVVK